MLSQNTLASPAEISSISLEANTENIQVQGYGSSIEIQALDEEALEVVGGIGNAKNLPPEGWSSSSIPRFEITLKARDGHRFMTREISKSRYYLLQGVTFVKAAGTEKTITLTVQMSRLGGEVAPQEGPLAVNAPLLDPATGLASWQGKGASKYYLVLYKEGEALYSDATNNQEYDFGDKIRKTGQYRFKVRAYQQGKYGEWIWSDTLAVDEAAIRSLSSLPSAQDKNGPGIYRSRPGTWRQDSTGWWYAYSDGTYALSAWKYINNKWYFFDAGGYMARGWVLWEGKWYYCSSDGDMLSNTTTPDGFRVDGSGAWIP